MKKTPGGERTALLTHRLENATLRGDGREKPNVALPGSHSAFLDGLNSAAEDPEPPVVVPVIEEPRHRLALEDEYLRLLDVRIPPGDSTLYHSHTRDSVYIPVSGFQNLMNQEVGKAAKQLVFKHGDVAYVEHSKAHFRHRVSNLGTEEFPRYRHRTSPCAQGFRSPWRVTRRPSGRDRELPRTHHPDCGRTGTMSITAMPHPRHTG